MICIIGHIDEKFKRDGKSYWENVESDGEGQWETKRERLWLETIKEKLLFESHQPYNYT